LFRKKPFITYSRNVLFANACWDTVCLERTQHMFVMETFSDIKEKLNVHFFMEIIILATWSMWIIRINKTFKNENPTMAIWKVVYFQELRMV
jgi:hypothetical protein